MLPVTASSAIDNANNINCESEDQRVVTRPQNGQCHIGSVKVETQGPTDINFKNGLD